MSTHESVTSEQLPSAVPVKAPPPSSAGPAGRWLAGVSGVRRRSRKLVLRAACALVLAQSATVGILMLVTRWRKRRRPVTGFPSVPFEEVEVDGNSLKLYGSGDWLFQDMLGAIGEARRSILLETYIWKSDRLGVEFKESLAAKAAAGVEVYVIYDHFANLVVPRRFKQFPSGVHVLPYGSFSRPWHVLDLRRYARDHRKLLVVDGEVAFLGGYNIGELYRTRWRDTHVRVRGPEAARLGQDFLDFWSRHRGPLPEIAGTFRRGRQPRMFHRTNDARRLLFPIRDMYVDAIDRAEKRVWITNAYFIPDSVMQSALIGAVQRGVDVRVVVPFASNHVAADWLGRGFYTHLLEHGVRIFCYMEAMIHAKTMTIDGEWSTVGTANLDRLSQIGNYEINLEVYDHAFATQMERLFDLDRSNAVELSAGAWRARPFYAKIGELVLAPLRPLF
ncbi:MAG TPA: phospholipase D-like domain-containing protein [Chloroflexota bacterium]|nr:phospholipase D-like domain-containing protein [Chloroflexota bacterium]